MSVMAYRKAGTANRKVTAPYVSEIKVTALAGWAIDAPVENNPVRPVSGRDSETAGNASNRLRVDVWKQAIT